MKRIKSMIGTIITTFINALQMIYGAYVLFVLYIAFSIVIDTGGENVNVIITFIAACIAQIMVIGALVLSIISYSHINAEHEKYIKKRPITILMIVLNFIIVGLFGITLYNTDKIRLIINVVAIAFLVLANILLIIDLCQEKMRTENIEKEKPTAIESEQEQN